MTKVIYRAVEADGCPPTTRQYGYEFRAGSPTEVDDGFALQKFARHPHFEVVNDARPTTPDLGRQDVGLTAKHVGGGSYSIVRGDERVKDGLTKIDAEAFNALSDDDKQAYVA